MTATIDIRELPGRLDELLATVAAGREVILCDGAAPRARLVPLTAAERVAGLHAGAVRMSPDFDDPLPDDFWPDHVSARTHQSDGTTRAGAGSRRLNSSFNGSGGCYGARAGC